MADSKQMPKVDMRKEFESLSDSQKYFVRKLESINKERAQSIKTLKRRNLMTGFLIGGCVLAICNSLQLLQWILTAVIVQDVYSMTAVRQEKFLDEFDTVSHTSGQKGKSLT